jgi:protein SCO1/2
MGGCSRRLTPIAAMFLAVILAGCGAAASGHGSPTSAHRLSAALDAPAEAPEPYPAPAISLHNSLGQPVTLSQYRGKAVLLTFIYDHCPDVCPLIVAHLHTALQMLGPKANQVQIVAVSVDPKGDTPATVKGFLALHRMTGRMQYLIGSKPELAPVWREWGVAVQATPDSREVGHSAFVYGINSAGQVIALYPPNFEPKWIAHDVPLLASS